MTNTLTEKMAGEITLSNRPGETIRKWREDFRISTKELAGHLSISTSVISDYESGRRKSPGVAAVKKIVEALVKIDEERGGAILKQYGIPADSNKAIIDIKEFSTRVSGRSFIDTIKGKILTNKNKTERDLHGYTIIDSLKAIVTLNSTDYLKIYGWSTERALIFTGVKYGRSPMIAVRAHPMKPAMVVFHKPENIDKLAIKLSEAENIPLVTTNLEMEKIIDNLRAL
ncbi:MAG: helix-turn-helix domain-containing protein [Thermoplasmata archaeon]